jgi:hypothetical protein
MANSPKIEFPLLTEGQALAHITINQALIIIDAMVQASFIEIGLNTPPATPALGDTYVVGGTPTGDWTGKANKIAIWYGGWYFVTRRDGFTGFDQTNGYMVSYYGGTWNQLLV